MVIAVKIEAMTTVETKAGVFKLDLTALRKADSVVFRHRDGAGIIECIRDAQKDDPFRLKARYEIQVPSSITDYDKQYTGESDLDYATEVILYAVHDEEWRTVVTFLKEGDEVSLAWYANNNSQNIVKAGLHNDFLRLRIRRRGQTYAFRIRDSICYDNTARMIRRGPWNA